MTSAGWTEFAGRLMAKSRPTSLEQITGYDFVSGTVSPDAAANVLVAMSEPSSNLNAGYQTPIDTTRRTSSWFPIIRSKSGYFLQPRSIATRAFCERLYALMRAGGDDKLPSKMGKALELVTVGSLSRFGLAPTIVNRKYARSKGETLELDMVVETDERIFLIECTKKPLTSPARAGSILAALEDLESSFLKLSQQLSIHEAAIREKGRIDFLDGSSLELKDRQIEKIGISLFDHGSLQSRNFTIALLRRLAGAEVRSNEVEAQEVMDKINARLRKINSSLSAIAVARPDLGDHTAQYFAQSMWWLSIDQLNYLMQKADGDLWAGLKSIRHLADLSGDFVFELKRGRELSKEQQKILEKVGQSNGRVNFMR